MEKIIYLVEDSPEIREMIYFLLEGTGYSVFSCPSAKSLQDRLAVEFPDLIILDVMLPDGNGIQICNAIKSTHETSHIPVLLMSATINEAITKRQHLAEDFIGKPFDIDDFVKKIERLIA